MVKYASMKKIFTPKQKAVVALEALRNQKTIHQLSAQFEAHPTQIGFWKKTLAERAEQLFADAKGKEAKIAQELLDRLYKIIGQRDIEIDWLKKKFNLDP